MSRETIRSGIRKTMGNEHCSYRSSLPFLRRLPTTGPYVRQGPGENSGVVDLGQGMLLALRIESHNHPSAIDPFEGSATGLGGILRDVFTMGARPIMATNHFFVGTDARASEILQGVVKGASFYGNQFGVPVVGGSTEINATYNGNPLVNVFAGGIVREEHLIYGHALTPGSALVLVGARTGMEGVGGSDFASKDLDHTDESNVHAIQKADPFLENLLMNTCVRLARLGLLEGMQDLGAAGVLCSTTEVIHRGQKRTGRLLGAEVDLAQIPLKEEKMRALDILRSETQERMLAVVRRDNLEEVLKTFHDQDLEAAEIGIVTEDGNYSLRRGRRRLLSMPITEICGEWHSEWPSNPWVTQGTEHRKASPSTIDWIYPQYDWRVGARTNKGPNEPGHFAILDIEEIQRQVVLSWSSDEGLSDVDPFLGVQHAFDRAYRYQQEYGATALGLTNCLNFGHPKDSMGAFEQTIKGLTQRCQEYQVPVVSGNVSLYNRHGTQSIKPTPMIVMVGVRNAD